MRSSIFLLCLFVGCGGVRSEPPPLQSRAAPAVQPAQQTAPAVAAADPDALCCCTFAFADPLDYGDVATWDSLATTCATGDADRFPGKCIDAKWCGHEPGEEPRTLADRPELAPRAPLPASVCCCDIFDGTGETFSVLDAATCKSTPDAHCVIDDFCPAPPPKRNKRN